VFLNNGGGNKLDELSVNENPAVSSLAEELIEHYLQDDKNHMDLI